MTDDNNNAFGEFGARSARFDELLKKYQTIDENGELVPAEKQAEPISEEPEKPKKAKSPKPKADKEKAPKPDPEKPKSEKAKPAKKKAARPKEEKKNEVQPEAVQQAEQVAFAQTEPEQPDAVAPETEYVQPAEEQFSFAMSETEQLDFEIPEEEYVQPEPEPEPVQAAPAEISFDFPMLDIGQTDYAMAAEERFDYVNPEAEQYDYIQPEYEQPAQENFTFEMPEAEQFDFEAAEQAQTETEQYDYVQPEYEQPAQENFTFEMPEAEQFDFEAAEQAQTETEQYDCVQPEYEQPAQENFTFEMPEAEQFVFETAEQAQTEAEQYDYVQPEYEQPAQENFTFEMPEAEQFDSEAAEQAQTEYGEGFTFDGQADQPQEDEEQAEPDYSYDLDMFGRPETKGTIDIDSFDDSWLDSALDQTVLYTAATPDTQNSYEPAYDTDSYDQFEFDPQYVAQDNGFVEQFPDDADKNAMAGGYIAPSDFVDFAFDPDSGMNFEYEESAEDMPFNDSEKQPGGFKTSRQSKKKESGKNEATCVTDFSKDYKASEGKGSKQDGFLVRNFIPKKDDIIVEKVRKIIMTVCLIAFFCSAMYLFNDYVIAPIKTTNQINELEEMIGEGDEVIEKEDLSEKYPDVQFPEGMLEKYADLYARNPDFAGWINIDGLDISLPVVRGEDNEKYLKTDFDGKHGKYGSIFMNCENNIEVLDYNTTLFGHYMRDTKMFGNLIEYKTVDGYKKAPVIEFNTLYGDYKWKVFAVFITNGIPEGEDDYLFNYMFTDLSNEEITKRFLSEAGVRTLYYPNVDVSPTDRILTLSTCTYEFEEARLVVMARMVRPGENEAVDTSTVKVNENPRYPATYYEEKGLSNPYASAYKWIPG